MRAFGKFEKGIENAIAGAFRVFQSELKPVEIITELKKAMDDNAAALARERTVAPNVYTVSLASADMKLVESWDASTLNQEFEKALIDYATEQNYLFVGPVRLHFQEDEKLREGSPEVTTTTARGAVAPATSAVASEETPLIQIGHEKYLISGPVAVIGRGSDCDITVDDSGVSRHHLELKITPHGVIATDLNSTNGTFVEGNRVSAATLVDGNTLTIGHTSILFWTGQ